MKWKGWQQLKENEKKGISMVLVLCVSAFFVAFAAAILYTAGTLTAQSNLRLKEERCYQLAGSYADVLEKELQKFDNKSNSTEQKETFYSFANSFLDDTQYLDYSDDYPDTTKYNFLVNDTNLSDLSKTAGSLPEGYGNVRIALSKEKNNTDGTDQLKQGEIPISDGVNYKTEIERIKNIIVRQYNLTVDVTASYEDATYTYSTEYAREEKYEVKFTHKGNVIVWDDNITNWRLGTLSGEAYTPEGENIKYEFQSTTTSCVFKENVYTETLGGGTTTDE